jgi:GLPGLI family protein
MKNNILRVFVVVSLFMLAVCIAASQGLYWESTISAPAAGKEMKSSNSYRAKMFKQSFENNTMIYRLDKETMYIVNNEKKEYAAMTFAEMEAAAKQANDRMAEVKKTLKNMPPAQREAMEKALNSPGMPGGQKSKIDIKKTAEKKTVNGYTCVKYILKENGKDAGTIWATSGVPDYLWKRR